MIRSFRARLRATTALAAEAIAPAWPLRRFIAVNPLRGFESTPFADAAARAAVLFGAQTLPDTAVQRNDGARDVFAEDATLAEWCAALGWGDLPRRIDLRMGRWLAAYFDESESTWSMPYRDRGFYCAWKRLARHENVGGRFRTAYRAAIDALPERSEDLLLANLDALGIEEARRTDYLQRHLAQFAGWSAHIKTLGSADDAGIDLITLLAVRTWYERCEVAAAAAARGINGTTSALRAWIAAERPAAAHTNPFACDRHAAALRHLDARETAFAHELVAKLDPRATTTHVPKWQIVFCIDARSEPIRRALEAADDIATFGFAGFFAVPFVFAPFEAPGRSFQAPALVRPTAIVEERPSGKEAAARRRHDATFATRGRIVKGALRFGAAFAGVEALGPIALAHAVARTLRPHPAAREPADVPLAIDGIGFDERVLAAEALLRSIGLTSAFAPIVVFCGHTAQSVNNAFAAALDCGACGGNGGLVNARVAAEICNEAAVRTALRERGIAIPETTRFVAAQHTTTTDELRVLDAAVATTLGPVLARAAAEARSNRLRVLPPSPLGANDTFARASDWAQTRPEWGLARNAAIVIGPRALSAGADLEGRAFLHSYDPHADDEGAVLEQILTAPLVVAAWINHQYFFATVDPERFGSGDKILQQPVGGFGVLSGNGGDLRVGLPLQSTTFGRQPYHEPLRLLAVIAAPTNRIDAVLARQKVVRRLFENRWIRAIAIDPHDGIARRYTGSARWLPLRGTPGYDAHGDERCSPIA